MPFTPFHFGPHTCVALPLQRYIDVPIFVGANVAIDIEPLLVMMYGFDYPLHGYCHTFLFGSLVGLLSGLVAFPFRKIIGKAMSLLRLPYSSSLMKMAVSGVLSAWMHILFDMPLYRDIKPFYPLSANPTYGIVTAKSVYGTCAFLFFPALVIYLYMVFIRRERAESIKL